MDHRTYYLLGILFILLNLFDALATIRLVVDFRVAVEINPVMRALLEADPWRVFFITKMIIGAFYVLTVLACRHDSPKWAKWSIIIGVIIYHLVMFNHFLLAYQCLFVI